MSTDLPFDSRVAIVEANDIRLDVSDVMLLSSSAMAIYLMAVYDECGA